MIYVIIELGRYSNIKVNFKNRFFNLLRTETPFGVNACSIRCFVQILDASSWSFFAFLVSIKCGKKLISLAKYSCKDYTFIFNWLYTFTIKKTNLRATILRLVVQHVFQIWIATFSKRTVPQNGWCSSEKTMSDKRLHV